MKRRIAILAALAALAAGTLAAAPTAQADSYWTGPVCSWSRDGAAHWSSYYGIYYRYIGISYILGTNGVVYPLATYTTTLAPPRGWIIYAWC